MFAGPHRTLFVAPSLSMPMSVFLLLFCALILLFFAINGRRRARKILLWKFGLLASEFGIYFVPPALVVAVASVMTGGLAGLPGALLALTAAGLLFWPEVASRRLLKKIPVPADAGRKPGAASHPRETFAYDSGGIARRLLFYRATREKPAPCVIAVHSGGWETGSPEEFPAFHRALAKSGYAVAAIEYGLAPAHPWPGPRADVRAALAWLKTNAASLGIDPDNLVLFGRSAGGQIALCAAYDNPDPGVRGVVSFYAPTDMAFAWRGSYDGDILDSPKLLKNYLGGRPHETPEIHADASPVVHAANTRMPTLLLHGRRDELVWCIQLRRLVRVLRKAGAPCRAIVLPWARHGFDYRLNGPGGRVAFREMVLFLSSVTSLR